MADLANKTDIPFRRPYRFVMALLVLITPFCTMVPYVAPAVFMSDIMQTFGIGLSLAGLSMTIQLSATGVCLFIGSFIQDKLGMKKVIVVSAWAMAIGNVVAWLSPNIYLFLCARLISGFGQGLFMVCTSSFIGCWFTGKERSYMLTLNGVSNSAFAAISYIIGRPICNLVGNWQLVFGVYAFAIAIIAILWTTLGKISPEGIAASQQSAQRAAANGKKQSSIIRAAKEVQYWKLLIYSATIMIANSAISTFLPNYLISDRGMSETLANTIASLNSIVGIAGSILGGVWCAQTGRRKSIIVSTYVVYIVLGFAITLVTSETILLISCVLLGALYYLKQTAQSAILVETNQPFDPDLVSGAVAITSGIGQFLTLIVSPIFSAITAMANQTVAFRMFFVICIAGLVAAAMMRETGPHSKEAKAQTANK